MKYTATDKTAKEKTKSKNIKTRVIPGYHLSLGIVVTMLSVIVLIPLASVLVYSLKISPGDFVALIMKENVRNAFITSITSSFIAAIVNVVFGLIVAWTLVKYDFPGKWLLDGLIELPFALPTEFEPRKVLSYPLQSPRVGTSVQLSQSLGWRHLSTLPQTTPTIEWRQI